MHDKPASPRYRASAAARGDMGSDAGGAPGLRAGELETGNAVRRSDSGQLSVSIDDVSKTERFKRGLVTLGRIRRLSAKAAPAGR